MQTYQSLQLQIEQLKAQAQKAREKELKGVISEINQKIKDYGISLVDLGFTNPKQTKVDSKKLLPPKYRNPSTGQTWCGRGKPPNWIAGKNKVSFLI